MLWAVTTLVMAALVVVAHKAVFVQVIQVVIIGDRHLIKMIVILVVEVIVIVQVLILEDHMIVIQKLQMIMVST